MSPQCRAFYEPLHESLTGIDAQAILRIGPGNWNSAHPCDARPYFDEYQSLLHGGDKQGVSGALTRFAFDDYFLPASAADEALTRYVTALCASGWQEGRLPVLKFTRSLGRLPWFRAQFPEAVHPVIIRDPWVQFRSAWRARMESRNGYFLAVPFLIMERNGAVPEVAALAASLGLPLKVRPATELLPRLAFWRLTVQRMPFKMLYRASFAFWLLSYMRALPEASFVLDLAAPLANVRAIFADHTGIDLEFGTSLAPPAKELLFYRNHKRPAAAAIWEIHATAAAALAPFVTEAALHRLMPWIDRADALAERDLNAQVTILPEPSLAHAAGLFLHAAYRWMKSQPGLSGPIAAYSRASRGSLPKQVRVTQGG